MPAGRLHNPGDVGLGRGPAGLEPGRRPAPGRRRLPRAPRTCASVIRAATRRGCASARKGTGHDRRRPRLAGERVLIKTQRMRGVRSTRPPAAPALRPARSGRAVLGPRPSTASPRWRAPRPTSAWSATRSAAGSAGSRRRYGLAANSVTAIELVTADGRLVRADADHDPDLFWALRGGGGSFGVVTAMEFDLYPVAESTPGRCCSPAERPARCSRPGANGPQQCPMKSRPSGDCCSSRRSLKSQSHFGATRSRSR